METSSKPISAQELEHELQLRKLQLKSLLAITQAINHNVSAEVLFDMYKTFINWDMRVERMAFYVRDEERWSCAAQMNFEEQPEPNGLIDRLSDVMKLQKIEEKENHPILRHFDLVIPVRHKDQPLSYTLIGGMHIDDNFDSKANFIQTITNIIVVAIENKRLFKEQLDRERIKRMMQVAGEVQHMFIPDQLPKNGRYEFDGIYKPHFNIGGDYFDYFLLSEDEIICCIADISGKGIGAAMVMANFRGILHNMVRKYDRLDHLVSDLNHTVYSLTQSDKFISFFIAKINTAQQTIEYVNAGHCPTLFVQQGEGVQFWHADCTVLGVMPDLQGIQAKTVEYSPQSTLVAYTDGLTELQNKKGELFDQDRLTLFAYTQADKTAVEFNEKLLDRLDSFRGDQAYQDDIAVLTCKLH